MEDSIVYSRVGSLKKSLWGSMCKVGGVEVAIRQSGTTDDRAIKAFGCIEDWLAR